MKKLTLAALVLACCVTPATYNVFAASPKAKQYTFYLIGSPDYSTDRDLLYPAYQELIFDLKDRYLFEGVETYNLDTCRLDFLMMCFLHPSNPDFSLYMPRNSKQWSKWTHGDQTYVFEGWKQYPFLPEKTLIGAVHAFDNEMLEDRKKDGGISYPQATYFIDKKARLMGMMSYSMPRPEERGPSDNDIVSFYWVKGPGLPLADF